MPKCMGRSPKVRKIIDSTERCANVLSPSHFPRWVRFYDEALPVAPSGKLDVVRMKANSEDRQELRYIESKSIDPAFI